MSFEFFPRHPVSADFVRELREDGYEAYSVAMLKKNRLREVYAVDIRHDGEDIVLVFEDGAWKPILRERVEPERVSEIIRKWINSRDGDRLTPISPEPWSGDRE